MTAVFAGGRCGVKCLDSLCGCMQRLHDTKPEAIEAWNTRAPSPGEAALLAALQGLMDAGIAVADSLAEFLDKRNDRMKIGPSSGNTRAVIRFGKYLDKGIWLTHPNLRRFAWRGRLIRLWFLDIHY